jgi:hypothetical protein
MRELPRRFVVNLTSSVQAYQLCFVIWVFSNALVKGRSMKRITRDEAEEMFLSHIAIQAVQSNLTGMSVRHTKFGGSEIQESLNGFPWRTR